MSGAVEDLLAEMRGLLAAGVRETPAGSNNAAPITDAPFFHDKWCAMTVSYCANRAGFPWLKTAQVVQIRAWAESGFHGMQWIPADQGKPGDLIVWKGPKGNHVNVVEKVDGGRYVHLGGNEQDAVRRGTWSNPTSNGMSIQGLARLPFVPATTPVVMDGVPVHEFGSRILKVLSPPLSGTDVAWWQTLMHVPVTGTYDQVTADATSEFQRKANVRVDGKVGPDTVGAMRRTLAFLAATEGQPA